MLRTPYFPFFAAMRGSLTHRKIAYMQQVLSNKDFFIIFLSSLLCFYIVYFRILCYNILVPLGGFVYARLYSKIQKLRICLYR